MKRNRIIWGLVALLVLTTITIFVSVPRSNHAQNNDDIQPTPEASKPKRVEFDLSRYPVVDFNAAISGTSAEREARTQKNKHYDGQDWVLSKPYPEGSGVILTTEEPPPPAVPVNESDLVLTGKILDAKTFLSNDKKGIYTEFTVEVFEVLKSDKDKTVRQGQLVSVDREGGYVRYSSGQQIIYRITGKGLPRVGETEILFLTTDVSGLNYQILTGYELTGKTFTFLDNPDHVQVPDSNQNFELLRSIREKVSASARIPKQ